MIDVVPMEATHVLLGRLWQYDTKAVHDGFTNKISFKQDDKKIVLKPLSPREVCEDQIKMRENKNSETLEKEKRGKREKYGL